MNVLPDRMNKEPQINRNILAMVWFFAIWNGFRLEIDW